MTKQEAINIKDRILRKGKIQVLIEISEEAYEQLIEAGEMDYLEIITAIENGIPFQKICDSENSEIRNEIKDLVKRVENLEKQMKEDKEEQIKKLKAELEYAKFSLQLLPDPCALWQQKGVNE